MKHHSFLNRIYRFPAALLVLFLVGSGCESTNVHEATQGKDTGSIKKATGGGTEVEGATNKDETNPKTIEAEAYKNLESRVNALQSDLETADDRDKKALEEQIAQLQKALDELKKNPPQKVTESHPDRPAESEEDEGNEGDEKAADGPKVAATSPGKGSAVATDSITITFDKKIDESKVSGSTLSLSPEVKVTSVIKSNPTFIFKLAKPLEGGKSYKATVSKDRIENSAGDAMAADYQWEFQTQPVVVVADMVWSAPVVMVSLACTPPVYNDGRVAVPLVITAFEEVNFTGRRTRFLMDEPRIGLNDRISSLKVEKGPNYVEGDEVELFDGELYQGKSIKLKPGYYENLGLHNIENSMDGALDLANNKPSSLKIARASTAASKTCAEVKEGDEFTWGKKIPIIVELCEHPVDYKVPYGRCMSIANDVGDLSLWGLGGKKKKAHFQDKVSALWLRKGPDYKIGDHVKFHPHQRGTGTPITVYPDQTYAGNRAGWIGNLDHSRWDFNDVISSVYFFDGRGNRIYEANDLE